MAIEKLTYTGTDGQTVTTGLTGFDTVSNTAGTMVFEDATTFRGASVSILATGSGATGLLYGSKDFTPTDILGFDVAIQPVTLPASGEMYFMQFGAGSTRNIALSWTSTGVLRVRDAANGLAWSSAAGVFEAGHPCIVSVYGVRDASDGMFQAVVYELDEVTERADSDVLTGQNTGANPFSRIRACGAVASTGATTSAWLWGEPRWDTAAVGLLPPPSVAESPLKRFDEGGPGYVDLDGYRWTGTMYVPIEKATP